MHINVRSNNFFSSSSQCFQRFEVLTSLVKNSIWTEERGRGNFLSEGNKCSESANLIRLLWMYSRSLYNVEMQIKSLIEFLLELTLSSQQNWSNFKHKFVETQTFLALVLAELYAFPRCAPLRAPSKLLDFQPREQGRAATALSPACSPVNVREAFLEWSRELGKASRRITCCSYKSEIIVMLLV